MRAVFEKCGYAKEGHFRQAWPVSDGSRLDSVEYGILRSDWETATITPVNWTDNII
jgi:RimJ/RimL family protein N-acetyltransferase